MSRKKNKDYVPNIRTDGESEKYVEIIEESLPDGTRFRYENEGRSAGRIKGVNYTDKSKTYPTIKIHGYQGKAYVVVSLVTNEPPHYPHPHKLIGNNCTYGVCSKEIDNSQMTCRFSDLRIQCVKRKEVKASLDLRQKNRVDPFRTGFSHSTDVNKITFDAVRLCFQVFLPNENGKYRIPLPPVISTPIYDSKTGSDLAIMKLSHCTAPVSGDQEVILLCGQINKNDIQIIFEEEKDKKIIWTANGKFLPHDVHRKSAISFKTPPYKDPNIREKVSCFIYLRRPSDKFIGKRREFTLLPVKEHKRPNLEDLRIREVIQQGNLALENFVGKNSRPNLRAVRTGAKREKLDMVARMKHMAIASGANYEKGAGNQFHSSCIPEREFKSPGTANVHGNGNYVGNVPSFCNYQNTVSTADGMSTTTSPYTQDQFENAFLVVTPPIHLNNAESFGGSPSTADDMSTVTSPYAQDQFENVFQAVTPPIQLNNAESFGGSPSTADGMSTVTSPYAQDQFENVFQAVTPPIQLNNAESFGGSPSTADDMSTVTSPYTQDQFENVFQAVTPPIQLNNAESLGGSPSTADHTSPVVSPYAPQLNESAVFSNFPQTHLNNDETFRDSLEDGLPILINNFNLESNPNDAATMSGLSITSNAEMDLLDFIGAIKDGKTDGESSAFHDNLRDDAVLIRTDNSLEELNSLNLDSNSSDLDGNISRLTIDSISESIAISILVDSHDVKNVDQRMSF